MIIGNPPYNAFAGVSPEEEEGLVEPYKDGLVKQWKIKKFNLDDLYIRFFRLAERRIAEKEEPGRGVLCYISNFSYASASVAETSRNSRCRFAYHLRNAAARNRLPRIVDSDNPFSNFIAST